MTFAPTKYAIRYWCDLDPGTGFNNAARGYLQAFKRLGLDAEHIHLAPAVLSAFGSSPGDTWDWTQAYTHRASADDVVAALEAGKPPPPVWDDSQAKINIVHLSPGLIASQPYVTHVGQRYNIAITAWETDSLPQRLAVRQNGRQLSVVEALNEFDEVWVPSRWNQRMFAAAGVDEQRLHVIRHALLNEVVDAAEAAFVPWPLSPFSFYAIGTWNARKDQRAVLQAYLATDWKPTTPVDLQLYCVPPTHDPQAMWAHQERAQREREQLLDGLVDPTGAPSHGLHTSRYVPYEVVIERHLAGGVLVSASHGEAFGLPLLEALALGRGVIAGGPWVEELAEIAGRLDDGGLVDVLPSRPVPITPMVECAGYEVRQRWWTVDQEELRVAMHSCLDAYREELAVSGPASEWSWRAARESAARVREHYGTLAVSTLLAERLQAIHEVLDGTGW